MITADELWSKHFDGLHYDDITPEMEQNYAIEFAQMHAEAALLKAKEMYLLNEANMSECPLYLADTIINAYPKTLIV